MRTQISNGDDILDVRDIIERFEELENELKDGDEESEGEKEELNKLFALLENLKGKGNGGDERWKGDWYPVTLIRDSHFNDAMDEMLEDCGELKPFAEIPSYLTITVDYKAFQMGYSSIEYDGVTYWYR